MKSAAIANCTRCGFLRRRQTLRNVGTRATPELLCQECHAKRSETERTELANVETREAILTMSDGSRWMYRRLTS